MQDERQPNALINEQSLYLQQHAYNPVDWYPWGGEALDRAREENKLIFLSIGYSSCHWCHVMEEEVFADEEVGAFLNEHYICIKVDREERPDVDAVYMEALLLLRGSGGWPLNMFLTPDRKPFFGGSYMPKAEFMARARRIQELFEDDPAGLAEAGSQLVDYVAAEPEMGQGGKYGLAEIGEAVAAMAAQFDPEWGGTKSMQKFPTPARWQFLLHYYRKTGDESAADRLRLTLDRMADGGLQDQLGGGFHRYSVDPQWIVPHFEKMLYD
ncbi:MAG TPA: thioredoxin domain-containing protein, partial [Firmicutes bacterium]|nr:thioredoxin domain-containing protein [Bacillota bacterium]